MFNIAEAVWHDGFLLGGLVCALCAFLPWGMSRTSLPSALMKAARLPQGTSGLESRRVAHASREIWIAKREIAIRIAAWTGCLLLCLVSWMLAYALIMAEPHVGMLSRIASGTVIAMSLSFAFSSTVALILVGGDNIAAVEVWSDSAGLLDRCAESDRLLLSRCERAVLGKIAGRAAVARHSKRL